MIFPITYVIRNCTSINFKVLWINSTVKIHDNWCSKNTCINETTLSCSKLEKKISVKKIHSDGSSLILCEINLEDDNFWMQVFFSKNWRGSYSEGSTCTFILWCIDFSSLRMGKLDWETSILWKCYKLACVCTTSTLGFN